jgi:hypothetical protein
MGADRTRTLRGALAGAAAAGIWAAQQPLDKKLFGVDYDDAELLGSLITRDVRDPATLPIGVAMHVANGAAFGALYARISPSLPGPRPARAVAMAMAEHLASWPLLRFQSLHPAARQMPKLWGDRNAFLQATWRHFLFGAVLGELERRLNPPPDEVPADVEPVSTNGHGNPEHLVVTAR